jgi:hypothetical protein
MDEKQLQLLIQEHFRHLYHYLDVKFNEVNQRLDELNKRLDELNKKTEELTEEAGTMKGYFYQGKTDNYYYNVVTGELFSYFRYPNGYEDEESQLHLTKQGLSFEQFLEAVKKLEEAE